MSQQMRNTKKSRSVEEFAEAIVDLYSADITAMSKSAIVNTIVDCNLGPNASMTIRTMLEDELANELERYFPDAVKQAALAIGRPWHLITNKYFKWEGAASSKYTAQQCLCVFGNGRTGKSAGVRFVPEGVEDDPLHLLHLEKNIDCQNKSISTKNKRIESDIESGAVTPKLATSFNKKLPHSGE